jgi:Ca2+-binding RTX toxin-like protein
MATYDASKATSGFDFTTFDLTGEVSPPPTDQTFRLTDKNDPATYVQFDGVLFEDNGSELTAGTITKITGVKDNSTLYEITGLALDVKDKVATTLANNDAQGFLAEVFSGADTLLGSNFNDHLIGYAGVDKMFGNNGDDTLEGGAGDDTMFGGAGADSMDGGDGKDTYDVDNEKDVAKDSGTDGLADTVQSSIDWTIDDSIENLTLTGTAVNGTGNASNNILIGNAGNNKLDGLAGADTMKGGNGNDTYIVDDVGDVVDEENSAGFDTVFSSASAFTLSKNVNDLFLTGTDDINGTGNELGNTIGGNSGSNYLKGEAGNDAIAGGPGGNDTLDGGTGSDTMLGGTGDDTYFVDDIGDLIGDPDDKIADEGTDTVNVTGINYELRVHQENLVLLGNLDLTGVGNVGKNHITGNDGDNTLAGDNKFDVDATGFDTLQGGKGDDTYLVWYTTDKVVENVGEGYDIVKAFRSFTLEAGMEIEELILTALSVLTPVDGTGNEFANKITGNEFGNKLSGAAGDDTLIGGTGSGNDTLDGGEGDDTMIGAAGDDLYVVDSVKDVITDSSGKGDGVRVTGADATLVKLYTGIENYDFSQFTGGPVAFDGTTAANHIVGTAANDSLNGGTGNDTLDGGEGDDTLDGGAGNDTYVIDVDTDVINETGKDSGDTIQTATLQIDLSIPNFKNIENVTFTDIDDKTFLPLDATGSDAKNILIGNSAANSLFGLAGNDTLIGGGGADVLEGGSGNDSMAGGTGDDSYGVDSKGDKVVENASSGHDVVSSTISYVLPDNVEDLVLVGGNLNGTGNKLANTIVGSDGNNILDGGRDGSQDKLSGGKGDDTYVVWGETDVVTEKIGEGTDTIQAFVDWILADDQEIENLTLMGLPDFEGTGNKLDNVITGNKGANKIDGKAGDDTMIGAAGDDIYTMDSLKDQIVEKSGGGADEIIFDLDDNDPSLFQVRAYIEHYNFSKYGGDAVTFTGDKAANRITGSSKADTLAGDAGNDTLDGGFGADSLTGGAGNDSYVLDNIGDKFSEIVNGKDTGGKDTIISMFDEYTLGDPSLGIENLTIGGIIENNKGTGNEAANVITGNHGSNFLSGAAGNDTIIGTTGDVTVDGNDTLDGGLGNDSMAGGAGDDTYHLDNKRDRVFEDIFSPGNDTIIANFSYVLKRGLENLTLTGAENLNGTGNVDSNKLAGNDGNNKLDGKANQFGGDTLSGGKGDDTYYVHVDLKTGAATGVIADLVFEEVGEGDDTVIVDAKAKSYTLTDNVENLTLTGSLASKGGGNDLDNVLIGNSGANTLQGEGGNDSLDGGSGDDSLMGGFENDTLSGGAGADTMNGDLGNDTYIVDSTKDQIIDKGLDTEIDTIQASISIDLNSPGFAAIEAVQLTGKGKLNATGDGGDNLLVGNAGANKLLGNAGDDTIQGGGGNDTIDGGDGDDLFLYTSKLDGRDVIDNFEGGITGQDVLDLDALFDSLGVATVDRAVDLIDKGTSVEVRVDVDGKDTNGAEFLVATLNKANVGDLITVGDGHDIVVGTL